MTTPAPARAKRVQSDLIRTQEVADLAGVRYAKARDLMSLGTFGAVQYDDGGKRCVSRAAVLAWKGAQKP